MEDLKRSKETPSPSCQRKSSRSPYINLGRGSGEGAGAAALGAAIGRAKAVVTVVGPATPDEPKSSASAVKNGPACAQGCTRGTRAALVALKLAAAFEPAVYVAGTLFCPSTTQNPTAT